MCGATQLTARSLDTGSRCIHDGTKQLSGLLHHAGTDTAPADAAGFSIANSYRYSVNITELNGTTYSIHDIRVNPMIDEKGRIIGISFPTRKAGEDGQVFSDEEYCSIWSRMPNRRAETEYIPWHRVTPTDGSVPYWQDSGPSQRAPWADEAEASGGMLYVHAHSVPGGFEVDANLGTEDDPDWRVMSVPGGIFGIFVTENEDMQAASRAGRRKPLMMLACGAGDPAYGHAEQAAKVIHDAGMNHTVYSTVGATVTTWNKKLGTAEIGVEVPDNTAHSDAVTIIRAPNGPVGPSPVRWVPW